MKPRARSMSFLVTGILLLTAGPARANIWDYLEQLSGPGPFAGSGTIAFSGACIPVGAAKTVHDSFWKEKTNLLGIPAGARLPSWTPCFFFDRNLHLSADADTRFPEIRLTMFDVGVTFPISDQVELGVGIGKLTFKDSAGTTLVTRTSATVPRVIIKPLAYWRVARENQWGSVLKFYLSAVVIAGTSGSNFGVSNSVYDESARHDWLTSVGFSADLLEAAGALKRSLK